MALTCHKTPKKWWSLSRYIQGKTKDTYPSLLVEDSLIDNDQGKADCFNKFFVEASNLDDAQASVPEEIESLSDVVLSECVVSESDVLKTLKRLNPTKAYGADGLSPILLKETANSIYRPLTYLFNKSLMTCRFPNLLKKANVIPFHKKNERFLPSNY